MDGGRGDEVAVLLRGVGEWRSVGGDGDEGDGGDDGQSEVVYWDASSVLKCECDWRNSVAVLISVMLVGP